MGSYYTESDKGWPMVEVPERVVAAACDGACSGNPGPGGWGALLRFENGMVREMGGADPATTNNRMELTAALAVLEALAELPRHPDLVIHTDSRYLIDGLQKWMAGWKRRSWRTASGGPVLNRDLWEQLDGARLAGLRLVHVRGHSGDPDNDRCDAIAVAFARGQRPVLSAGPGGIGNLGTAEAAGAAAGMAAEVAPPVPDLAPPPLQQLLTRLELAERLAAGGYGLSLVELAQLVELPLSSLEARDAPWPWRDWLVHPLDDGRWRLERGGGGLAQRP
jgi:ribonuclease HI